MVGADPVSAAAVATLVLADRPARLGALYGAVLVENLAIVFFRPAARAATPLVGAAFPASDAAAAVARAATAPALLAAVGLAAGLNPLSAAALGTAGSSLALIRRS
jgi:hypothetical protein